MRKLVIVSALAWMLVPGTASADWLFTPNVGGAFGGGPATGWSYGGSLAWMGEGILGLEGDFAFNSNKDLFNQGDADLLGIDRDFFQAKTQTAMLNAIVGVPFGGSTGGGVTPFFAAGLGNLWMKVKSADELFDRGDNNLGLSLGTGAFGYVSDNWGLRGDIRWYYSITEPSVGFDLLDAGVVTRVDTPNLTSVSIDRSFWRATGGVTFRF